MDEQVKRNMELVNNLIAQNTAQKSQVIQQGNKAAVPVDIDYEADSGEHYSGTLYFRRPSSMDYIRMGAIKSELLRSFGVRPIVEYIERPDGGLERLESMAHVDASVKYLAQAVAACDVLLTGDVPAWFRNHRGLEDTDLVVQVYRRFDEELASFRSGARGGLAGRHEAGERQEAVAPSQAVREREHQGDGGHPSAE